MARKASKRSLEQLLGDLRRRSVAKESLSLPELRGAAHRFTVFFPLLSGDTGRGIFSEKQATVVGRFLSEIFEGCSIETVSYGPPLTGLWWQEEEGAKGAGEKKKRKQLVVDGHTRIVVYTAWKDEATDFFLRLKKSLEKASGETIILIEKAAVSLVGE